MSAHITKTPTHYKTKIIAVYSQIHTKNINILCGQNVELLNVKNLVIHMVTTGL